MASGFRGDSEAAIDRFSSIDTDDLTGDVARSREAKEGHQLRHLLCLAHSP